MKKKLFLRKETVALLDGEQSGILGGGSEVGPVLTRTCEATVCFPCETMYRRSCAIVSDFTDCPGTLRQCAVVSESPGCVGGMSDAVNGACTPDIPAPGA